MTISRSLLERHDLFKWRVWLKFSRSRRLTLHLSFCPTLLPIFISWVVSDPRPPHPFAPFFNPTMLPMASFNWLDVTDSSTRLHLARPGCTGVRVLNPREPVMRYDSVVTVVYYESGRNRCCGDFGSVVAFLWGPHYAFVAPQDSFWGQTNSSALLSYDSVQQREGLKCYPSPQVQFYCKCKNRSAVFTSPKWTHWTLNDLTVLFSRFPPSLLYEVKSRSRPLQGESKCSRGKSGTLETCLSGLLMQTREQLSGRSVSLFSRHQRLLRSRPAWISIAINTLCQVLWWKAKRVPARSSFNLRRRYETLNKLFN